MSVIDLHHRSLVFPSCHRRKFAFLACVVPFTLRQFFAHGVSNFDIFPRVMWHFFRGFCIGCTVFVYVFHTKSLHRENRSNFQRPASHFI